MLQTTNQRMFGEHLHVPSYVSPIHEITSDGVKKFSPWKCWTSPVDGNVIRKIIIWRSISVVIIWIEHISWYQIVLFGIPGQKVVTFFISLGILSQFLQRVKIATSFLHILTKITWLQMKLCTHSWEPNVWPTLGISRAINAELLNASPGAAGAEEAMLSDQASRNLPRRD